MRASRLLLATLKESPAEAEIVSHQLMLRAGMVRKLAAGLYSWLPMGLRVLRKAERVVREEMERAGAQELLMPVAQPAELWQESGRWEQFGPELFRLADRHQRPFALGPTHEEVITDIVRREIHSHRQLPLNFYQIQTKFRDEARPRFGIMRAREFLMKDAYSFHLDEASLKETYAVMHDAYARIFTRLGLRFRAVAATSGAIGGSVSHEFHVLADSGEDAIAYVAEEEGDYAANIEMVPTAPPTAPRAAPRETMRSVETPGLHTVAEVCARFDLSPNRLVKTLLVEGEEGGVVALALRGDHALNAAKAAQLPGVAAPLAFADAARIHAAVGVAPGSLGPVGLPIPLIVDHAAAAVADFACGANVDGQHLLGVNWGRDLPEPERVADLRNAVAGDPSPDGRGTLQIARGIEVGHIFQLGSKYSEAMGATALDEQGQARTLVMGCYGIGVSRIVAAAIEQNHDAQGIVWPLPLAPFAVALLPMNMHKSERVRAAAEQLYRQLTDAGVETLFDDRGERPGVMFAEMELIGIPHRIVVGERGLEANTVEYRDRRESENRIVPRAELIAFLRERLGR